MEWTISAQGLQLRKGPKILLSSTFENFLQLSPLHNWRLQSVHTQVHRKRYCFCYVKKGLTHHYDYCFHFVVACIAGNTCKKNFFVSFKTCSIFNINRTTDFSPSHNEELRCTLELLHIAAGLIVIPCSSLLTLPYYPEANYAGYHAASGPISNWMQSKY